MTLEKHLDKLGDHFIGLWRFRVKGQPRLWCVTLHCDGNYYDTWGKRTPEAALAEAYRIVEKELSPGRKERPAQKRRTTLR